jgi:hypothetical protein
MNKEIKQHMKRLEALGFEFIGLNSKGHPLMKHNVTGAIHEVPATPSDARSLPNNLSTARKLADPNHPWNTERR